MKEQNEINEINDSPKNDNILINDEVKESDNKEKNKSKKEMNYFLFEKDIYNAKGTKIKEKEKFIKFMTILNQYIQDKTDFIFLYLKKIKVDLIRVLFNGYISTDFQNVQDKKNFLSTIKIIMNSFFSKDLFFIVYNKLSKIFRKFNLVENKEMLFDKFNKIFDLWNLLYNLNNKIENNSNYISLIGNQVLTLVNKIEQYQFKCIDIFIEFDGGINQSNNSINDFSFVSVKYEIYGLHTLKSDGILNEKEKENVKNIYIKINDSSIGYLFNADIELDKDNDSKFNKIMEFKKADNFAKIEILKNYIGKIRYINIKIKFREDILHNMEYEIIPSGNNKGHEIIPIKEKEGIIDLSFDNKLIFSQLYKEIYYEDIRYYGGFESFIPIIKIIKYFMAFYKDNNEKINILNDIIIKIMKNIIKLISYSINNFDNLKKNLTSLIAAFAEINHLFPNNKNSFYSHYTFTILYILIMISTFPFSTKKYYAFITGLDSIDKLNLNFEDLIIDVNSLNIISYKWYTKILVIILEFILIKYNNINIIPKKLIEQLLSLQKVVSKSKEESLLSYVNFSIQVMNHISTVENEEIKLFGDCQKIEDLTDYFKQNIINNEQNLSLIFNMMKTYFNLINYDSFWSEIYGDKPQMKELDLEIKGKNLYINKIRNFFNYFEILFKEEDQKLENNISKVFKNYLFNKDYLIKIFPFLKTKDEFIIKAEIYFSEFIDFHKDYHKLMKNIFSFNKLWSDKKLFFTEEKRQKYLKYKTINYYTTNYQRPLIFPHLDYKSAYPDFTKFQLNKDFYTEEENPDNYNFNLDCPELDNLNIKYEQNLLSIIKTKNLMNIFEVCLVKKAHHIKGKLIIINNNGQIKKILFISYPSIIAKNIPCCNAKTNNPNYNKKNEKLCYGAIFACPEKYMNNKIVINISDIRMVLKRIYFYRKSAVEIFTLNKSYFFNFSDCNDDDNDLKKPEKGLKCEVNCENFINLFCCFINVFFPIKIRNTIIGHSRQFQKILAEYIPDENKYNIDIGDKFIQFLFGHWTNEIKGINLSTLDLLIYLNLLSNRSYNDLFQYPVFPLFFVYDKIQENNFKRLERKLNRHIGFQIFSEKAKQRKQLIKQSFKDDMNSINEEEEDRQNEIPSYFQTHFSTHIYTCDFLIRIFPYSFISIELQGAGFDSPNRLFFSIEYSFYNISCHKSDLRELIPEFYYFPEMFLNINRINFHKRSNDIQVDSVIMPQDICQIGKDKDKNNRNSINLNDEYENSEYFKSFKFVEKLRNILESKKVDILSWINLIFGSGQKYKKAKRKDLLFRNESYIDYTPEKAKDFVKYRQDKNIMTSVDFGLTPIQIVFDGDVDIWKTKGRNNCYDFSSKDVKQLFPSLCKSYTDKIQEEIEPKKKEKDKGKDKDNKDNKDKKIEDDINKKEQNIKLNIKIFKARLHSVINTSDNTKKLKHKKLNKTKNNELFLNPKSYINCVFQSSKIEIKGYKTGKVEVYNKQEGYSYSFFDHSSEIVHINYNKRLNMMCTTSKDGFLNVYILPNKLVTTIKNLNNSYFKIAFLSSNPFPSIIALENESLEVSSYSINGFKIKKVKLNELLELGNEKKDLWFVAHFNEDGGNFKDRLICIERKPKDKEKETIYNCYLIKVPFLELEEKFKDIKYKQI